MESILNTLSDFISPSNAYADGEADGGKGRLALISACNNMGSGTCTPVIDCMNLYGQLQTILTIFNSAGIQITPQQAAEIGGECVKSKCDCNSLPSIANGFNVG